MQPLPGRNLLEPWAEKLGIRLDSSQWSQLESYLQDVSTQNETVNLTADSGKDLFVRHAADALAALPALKRYFSSLPKPSFLDLGAGAGFIGITLKIAWTDIDVTLLESSYRKFQFLNSACANIELTGLHVILGRAPQALNGKNFDVVIIRAVASLDESANLGLTLTRPNGGLCLCYQTAAPATGDLHFDKTLSKFGARIFEIVPYRLVEEDFDRHLIFLKR